MEKATPENFHHYNNKLRKFAGQNRKGMNKAEACMWKFVLSKGQMKGYPFRRQRPILNYIADFMCMPLKLIIEVDGDSHESLEAQAKDLKRNQDLSEIGFTTLRFSNWEVHNRIGEVAQIIALWIEAHATVPPPARRKG